MTLKAYVETLDEVDEAVQEHYVANGDGYALQVDGIREHPDVTSLRHAYDQEKQKRKTASDELKQLKANQPPEDFDPDLWNDLYSRYKEGKLEGADPQKLREELRKQMEPQYEQKVSEVQQEKERYRSELERTVIGNALTSALVKANVDKRFMAAARALHANSVKVEEGDNGFQAVIETDMGPQPVEKYIADWAQTEEGQAFVQAPPNGGGGATGSQGTGSGRPNPWKEKTWNLTEQGRIRKENPELAARLKAEAGQ